MGIQDFGTMDPNASLKQVINELANLMDSLNFLLNGNLDVKNIRANSITAKALKVDELSAISANMGTITAGSLTTNAQINVGTDATVGDNLTVGDAFSGADSVIFLNFATLNAPNGSDSLGMITPGVISITSSGDDINLLTYGSHRVSVTAPGGFWVNGILIAP